MNLDSEPGSGVRCLDTVHSLTSVAWATIKDADNRTSLTRLTSKMIRSRMKPVIKIEDHQREQPVEEP